MQKFTWDSSSYPSFAQPIPAGIAINNPAGDDYTAALISSFAATTNNQFLMNARAPLPLLTNKWAIQSSSDFKNWTAISNVSGTQYTAQIIGGRSGSNVFYRVKSLR